MSTNNINGCHLAVSVSGAVLEKKCFFFSLSLTDAHPFPSRVAAILSIHHLPSIAPSRWLLRGPSHMASPSPLRFVLCHACGCRGRRRVDDFNPSQEPFFAPATFFLRPSVRQRHCLVISPQLQFPIRAPPLIVWSSGTI